MSAGEDYGNPQYGHDQIITALVAAQAQLSAIQKNKKVTVTSRRTGAKYDFMYATFDKLVEHVRKPLTDNGLWFVQTTELQNDKTVLITTLYHKSGQHIRSELALPASSDPQEFGSGLTYFKRYGLAAVLAIAADEDEDGNAASGNTVVSSEDRPEKKPTRAADTPLAADAKEKEGKAYKAAIDFGTDAVMKIRGFKSLDEFDAWQSPTVRNKIAKIRDYDLELHKLILDEMDIFVREHKSK